MTLRDLEMRLDYDPKNYHNVQDFSVLYGPISQEDLDEWELHADIQLGEVA